MRAIVQDRYGPPSLLRVADADRPEPTDEQVLVRVHASSVNALDWRRTRGEPFFLRLSEGLRRPTSPYLGGDAAGVVEAIGSAVTHLKPGDEVYGIRTGSFAEYVAGKSFVRKPANLSFEEAAAVPIAGVTALQAVRDHAAVKPGQRVLVNGAGGGVGTMTVQVAKAYGAEVIAVTGSGSVEAVRSLGADEVIDYTQSDFTRGERRIDVLIDVGGNRSIREMRRVVRPGGRLVLVGAGKGSVGPLTRLVGSKIRTRLGQTDIANFLAGVERSDLDELRELVEAGKLRPLIDSTYPLDAVPQALARVESGGVRGKVVITIA